MITKAVLELLGTLGQLFNGLPDVPALVGLVDGAREVGLAMGRVMRAVPFVEWVLVVDLLVIMFGVLYPALLTFRVVNYVVNKVRGSG